MSDPAELGTPAPAPDPEERIELLLRDLRSSRSGLSSREAQRRIVQFGGNVLARRGGRRWPRELVQQFTHPLALLLWAAAGLAWAAGIVAVAVAIVVVIVINAVFAFVQEMQAERAVEALAAYLPPQAKVLRDGREQVIDAAELVPGDLLVIDEGDRISADARLLSGAVEVDLSTLTGESMPVFRSASLLDTTVPVLQARDLVFSGSTCTEGEARALVFATGMRTELGRIAALSERVEKEESPLEAQVRRVAWLIALIAVVTGVAFVPIAVFGAGLSVRDAVVFAVGLLVGNVPGTLTENRMQVTVVWTAPQTLELEAGDARPRDDALSALALAMAACNNAQLDGSAGDPTELAMLAAAGRLGANVGLAERERDRRRRFQFDPELKLMSTVDERDGRLWVNAKGAPEALVSRCATVVWSDGRERPFGAEERAEVDRLVAGYAGEGLRVLGVARRHLDPDDAVPERREEAERDLCFLGLVAMLDPPRAEVPDAVAACHRAGLRIIVVTGDHGLTAAAIARRVGIARKGLTIITGEQLDAMSEPELDELLREGRELIFARSSPEAKLRIADALRAEQHVVAMTGDGVNDAPALRRADIGVAMGRSGTDVAREASTMVLTDDNFATLVTAVRAGRQIYDNVRKFILYIFAHATPEVMPFLVFGLAGGAIPLPLTILQLLAFDVGSETLPALALSREPPEPGLMDRPPRARTEGVIRGPMLIRAWLFLGLIVAALQMGGFFYVLTKSGWSPGDPVGPGDPLHHAYQQATTMTFLGMIAGQIGTAFAVRTQRASLRSVGVFSNPYLLAGIAGELVLVAIFVYTPVFQSLLGTAPLPPSDLLLLVPYPFIVWGADELRRYIVRRRVPSPADPAPSSA